MLGKLIKYEWKSVYKVCTIVLAVVLAVSLVGVIFFNTPLWTGLFDWDGYYSSSSQSNNVRGGITVLLGMGTLMLYICGLIGGTYGIYIYLLVHFYKSMYTDEGYLTHTLPVNPHHLLFSKVLVGGLWVLITEAVTTLSVIMVLYSFIAGIMGSFGVGVTSDEFFRGILELYDRNSFVMVISLIMTLLFGLISPFASICMYFGGISLGQLSKSYKGLMSILACFGVIFVNMILSFFVNIIISAATGVLAGNTNIGTMLLTVGMGVGCYFLTHYLMTSKLNLE